MNYKSVLIKKMEIKGYKFEVYDRGDSIAILCHFFEEVVEIPLSRIGRGKTYKNLDKFIGHYIGVWLWSILP